MLVAAFFIFVRMKCSVFTSLITPFALLMAVLPACSQQVTNPVASTKITFSPSNPAFNPFNHISALNIGPTIMGGRVVDVEVNPQNPAHFFVAFASGGLWQTINNGQSFNPVFDKVETINMGDVTIHWPSKTIYVGTGEANSSRSSYAGRGVYKSVDGGNTWAHAGLPESHHIARMVVHPANPDIVYAAVTGHLYSPNKERGIYKSSDGGKTWQQQLFINENTGGIDLVMHPANPDELYAAMWDRKRRAWNFWEAGAGSGIYKTTDGGNKWQLVSGGNSGFPGGEFTGRIGLSLSATTQGTALYALLDNQSADTTFIPGSWPGRKDFEHMSKETFLQMKDSLLSNFLLNSGFDEQYSATRLKNMVKTDSIKVADIYHFLSDANTDLFETKIIGNQLYRSLDGGKSWQKTHEKSLNKVGYTYGYYFGMVSANPKNHNEVYIAGVPLLRSSDGGKTFNFAGADNLHVDHHVLWINPQNPAHLINGNDGGVAISYDSGQHWMRCNHPPVGQFYSVYADKNKNFSVYGGLQDNGVWKGPPGDNSSSSWQMYGKYPFDMILGGDGMQVAADEKNSLVYTGYQFGHYYRIDEKSGKRTDIQPKHALGEKPLRFNWQSPIWVSQHNADILYFGSNKVHRSLNRGDNWQAISGDLTEGGLQGDVSYGTLTTLHESPFTFGQLLAGTDDGHIYLSPDGGNNWQEIGKSLPQHLWVSRARFSIHHKSTIYAALNGYRWDHFEPYLFKSTDLGKTWVRLNGLPQWPVNSFSEDLTDSEILYVATDGGLFVTTDGGKNFLPATGNMPAVAVHDIALHSSGSLFAGTHGRSLYKLPVKYYSEYKKLKDSLLVLLPGEDIRWQKSWGEQQFDFTFNEPATTFNYWNRTNSDSLLFTVSDSSGALVYHLKVAANQGFASFTYRLQSHVATGDKPADNGIYYLLPGVYQVALKSDVVESKSKLVIKEKK